MSHDDSDRFMADIGSHRTYRLASYCEPISPPIKRGLALEDALAAAQRAACAVIDASHGEADKYRVVALRDIYVSLRIAVTELERLQ